MVLAQDLRLGQIHEEDHYRRVKTVVVLGPWVLVLHHWPLVRWLLALERQLTTIPVTLPLRLTISHCLQAYPDVLKRSSREPEGHIHHLQLGTKARAITPRPKTCRLQPPPPQHHLVHHSRQNHQAQTCLCMAPPQLLQVSQELRILLTNILPHNMSKHSVNRLRSTRVVLPTCHSALAKTRVKALVNSSNKCAVAVRVLLENLSIGSRTRPQWQSMRPTLRQLEFASIASSPARLQHKRLESTTTGDEGHLLVRGMVARHVLTSLRDILLMRI